MNRTLRAVTLFVLLVSPSAVFADTWNPLTLVQYEGATGTTPQGFSVWGDIFGPNNILSIDAYGNKTWQDTWSVESREGYLYTAPYWSIFARLLPPESVLVNSGVGRIKVSSNGGFEYQELISGLNSATHEFWSHEILITGPLNVPLVQLIGVQGAFNYVETVLQASNYSTDGSTSPLWSRWDATGTTTMTKLKSVYPEAFQVPEPASLAMLGVAGFVLSSRRVYRKSADAVNKAKRKIGLA